MTIRKLSSLAALGLLVTAACGDTRVKNLSEGIDRDSVLTILRDGDAAAGPDSLRHVYEVAAYLVGGNRYEIFYYTKGDEVVGVDSLPPGRLTPIVLKNDSVTGWGWEHWDSVAKTINLPLPAR